MNEIIKRLRVIKSAIEIEEYDIIQSQVAKISTLNPDSIVKRIIYLINANSFQNVIGLINKYEQDYNALSIYDDPVLAGLRLELKILENELADKTAEKDEYEHYINQFNQEYLLRVGELLEQILQLKLSQSAANSEEYAQIKESFDDFEQEYIQSKQEPLAANLNEEQEAELKKAYRQASRLCHPDRLAPELQTKGAEFFKELSNAYRRNDLSRVKEILTALQINGGLQTISDRTYDKESLLQQISLLKERIEQLTNNVKEMLQSEIYQHIQSLHDRAEYFVNLKQELTQELIALQTTDKE